MTQSYADCNQIRNASGVYTLNLTSIPGLQQAYCDMETAESGFIVSNTSSSPFWNQN